VAANGLKEHEVELSDSSSPLTLVVETSEHFSEQ
jgi:hypothetical protein